MSKSKSLNRASLRIQAAILKKHTNRLEAGPMLTKKLQTAHRIPENLAMKKMKAQQAILNRLVAEIAEAKRTPEAKANRNRPTWGEVVTVAKE